jgi:two-component system, NarL family, response regulator LiaR
MADPIRVVLVDDHHVARHGLQSFLKAFDGLAVVGEATSGEEALQKIEEWMPDVVVMDLLMPGGITGIETIKQVRALLPHTRIVAMTSSTDDALVGAALRAGAIGYVRKEARLETLLSSIRAAARGQSLLDPAVASVVMQELTRVGKPGVELTEREQEVLRQLALGRTNHEIADALAVSDETVKTHVGNILTKLQLAHRTQAVIYALKKGLISLDEIEFP